MAANNLNQSASDIRSTGYMQLSSDSGTLKKISGYGLIILVFIVSSLQAAEKPRNTKPPVTYLGPPVSTNGDNSNQITGSQGNSNQASSVTSKNIKDFNRLAQQAQLSGSLAAPNSGVAEYQDSVQIQSLAPGGSTPPVIPPADINIGVCGVRGWDASNGHYQCTSTTWAPTPSQCYSDPPIQCP